MIAAGARAAWPIVTVFSVVKARATIETFPHGHGPEIFFKLGDLFLGEVVA